MTWMRFDPDEFWSLDVVERMDLDAAGLLLWLISRSWKTGAIRDDPAHYKAMLRGKCKGFDKLWPVVREAFEEVEDGLRVAWVEEERERAFKRLQSDASKKALARSRRGSSLGTPQGLPRESLTCPVETDGRDGRDVTDGRLPAADKPPRKRAQATGDHPECIQHWEAEWTRTRLGTTCTIAAKDGAAVAWMLRQQDAQEVRRRITAMLEDSDAWIAKNASLTLLRSKWDSYAVTVTATPKPGNVLAGWQQRAQAAKDGTR